MASQDSKIGFVMDNDRLAKAFTDSLRNISPPPNGRKKSDLTRAERLEALNAEISHRDSQIFSLQMKLANHDDQLQGLTDAIMDLIEPRIQALIDESRGDRNRGY